jgi:hypothetical protein
MLIDLGLCCDNESNIFYVHFYVNFDVKDIGILQFSAIVSISLILCIRIHT